jgi:hypothetical protein
VPDRKTSLETVGVRAQERVEAPDHRSLAFVERPVRTQFFDQFFAPAHLWSISADAPRGLCRLAFVSAWRDGGQSDS